MARAVVCLGAFAIATLLAVPASARPVQIDPRMNMLSDGPAPAAQQHAAQQPRGSAGKDSGVPLDQMDSSDDDGPAGDDPYSDNAVQSDTVYTA